MSHHTLQNLVARLLFDETLVAALYANPEQTLAGLELTEAEREQLLSVDCRAWRYDALRRRRTLQTLVEEFKISTTIALSATRSLASLEGFFASSFFHAALQQRGSLAMAFSEFLLDGNRRGDWAAPQLQEIIRLETIIAGCRRKLAEEGPLEAGRLPTTINEQARVRLASGYDVGSFQANIIATIQQVEQYLFEMSLMPAMALCDDAPRLPALPEIEPKKKSYLLFGPGASGISLTDLDKHSFLILYEAKRPVEIKQLLTRLGATANNANRAQEILAEWLEDGALILVQ